MWFIELLVGIFTSSKPSKSEAYKGRYLRKIEENKEMGL